jgi:Flp pilus assembly protein TadD
MLDWLDAHPRERTGLIAVALAAAVVIAYLPVGGAGFVNLDDQQYVYANPYVLRGLSWDGVLHAFTAFDAANWHPLTWLSLMADVQLFGPDPHPMHALNVLLHLFNTLLLFAVLQRATGAAWRSAAVAALFGLHPLHVESVAWISERKDVLSTAFLLLTLGAYVQYARRKERGWYAAVLASFALGLLCKPMLVTVPFLLLLLDAWPLGRMTAGRGGSSASLAASLVREKLPLLALAAVSSAVTYLAQARGGATVALIHVPLSQRLGNALVACVVYLRRTVWPSDLASFYPHPSIVAGGVSTWAVAGSALVLAAVTAIVLWQRRSRPYLAWGWCWYLGSLLPVIGVVQVGSQAMADRYTYVPLVGPFVALVWGAADALARVRQRRVVAGALAAAAVVLLTAATIHQVGFWKDAETLHRRSLAVTDRNWQAWLGLADALSDQGRLDEALDAGEQALRILPRLPQGWDSLGVTHGRRGNHDLAIRHFREALRLDPSLASAWYNLGTAYGSLGQHGEAASCFREAVRLRPDDARAWANLGIASLALGDRAGAMESYQQLLRLEPRRAEDLRNRIAAAGG